MNIPSLSDYAPYVNRVTNYLDAQTASAQQSIDELHRNSASYEVRISDYGMIQSDLANLESAAQQLSGPDAAIVAAIDPGRITGTVQSFIDSYNRVQAELSKYRAGGLPDDRTLAEIGNRLSAGASPAQPASDVSLEQIGITRNQDGALTFDTLVFQDAYSRNPAGVARLFTGNGNGLADQASVQLQNALQPGGGISSNIDQLLSKIRKNQQMESHIEDSALRNLQQSAHQHAQQLAMMVVAHIMGQFMQDASSRSENHPGTTTGASRLKTLMSDLASRYNNPSPAANPGVQA
ncbi:flagellar filament capping protein FliD [Candidatus Ferrigenium straubiae]|uniref:flagellar filament capping protein FliD n=1 Tax=Candidatus Ferrigenium straubiae TaxID=2919506 RepID=UPI003F4AB4FF